MNYELTDETIQYDSKTLYRIRALVDMPIHNVKAGELGRFVEKIENLRRECLGHKIRSCLLFIKSLY